MIESTAPIVPPTSPTGRLRPPAVPLVTHTPYFSAWCRTDLLTKSWARHWTGGPNPMCGMLRIDGVSYRFLGASIPDKAEAMAQVDLTVLPTRTVYEFEAAGVGLTLEFLSPLLPDDLEVLSRPVTYIGLSVRSLDGAPHHVEAYFDANAFWCVDASGQHVEAFRTRIGSGLEALSLRCADGEPLRRAGDEVRIDWGDLLLCAPGAETAIAGSRGLRSAFVQQGHLPQEDDTRFPRQANDDEAALAAVFNLGSVGAEIPAHALLLIGYDEQYAFEFMSRRLRPYWRRKGQTFGPMLVRAVNEYATIRDRAIRFDESLEREMTEVGGPEFAALGALSYRQSIAAHGLAEDFDGTLLMLSKENLSNGCIGTVDVTYPSSPLYLHLNPVLLRAQVEPVLIYAASSRWNFPFAPHDLGTYPLANGQVYGGGERTTIDQMPVEECGNMLLLVGMLCANGTNGDLRDEFWPELSQWADFLLDQGLDPANQLCTDDFAGHMAHNANLSIKAILALGAYARLASERGDAERAKIVRNAAETMAREWMSMADDGDHTRLGFDQPGTWSQKYNLVWDCLLGLDLFPAELAAREVAFYRTKLEPYGLPLDSRREWTKLDWCVWSACLATDRKDFDALIAPVVRFADETEDRVPLSDWYDAKTAEQEGFQARSVVGGVFIPLLPRR